MTDQRILLSGKYLYVTLYVLLAVVYISGTFIPLMENDSAQHAVMAMRMYLNNDYIHLMRGFDDYLDKPHMHFWLSALSYKLFGLNQWAYRIPALIFTIIGAYSCYKLTEALYHKNFAHYGALIFLSSQAIILANHDVRTDAVLTGAVILATWQLYVFIRTNKLTPLIIAAIALGIAFSTKGLFGVVIVGFAILFHIAYTKNWKVLWNYKILIGFLIFILTITPTLYAYYIQFDMHPEKVVKGHSNISGVRFILWDQSFNRLTSTGFSKQNPDYFFFFHTLLWAFLPWAIIAYSGIFSTSKAVVKTRFRYNINFEVLTLGGILLTLLVISFSQFKLPHYLNPILPMLSVLSAGYLYKLTKENKTKIIQIFLYIQYGICVIGILALTGILFFTFESPSVLTLVGAFCFFTILLWSIFKRNYLHKTQKILTVSVLLMVLINFSLNTYFYPHLLEYQSGGIIAKKVNQQAIEKEDLYILDKQYRWSLDFYSKRHTPSISMEEMNQLKKEVLVVTTKKQKVDSLYTNKHIKVKKEFIIPHFRITKLSAKFLNPKRRTSQLDSTYVLKVMPR
ncbi:glycosyltransferase family 39 protein [Galbibacter sp. EGI 63066]|uniref:ArnT family glycosyltransferase n=1 Tax=Galbibacter sp. EGI 63066 TaxID=2993559 RepID=UPI002249254F|nr:glycosyltransferase family 39 protein [Galbibacter sp. EGI 63066]MCX2682093.1 glycosyltransferase family 39 protein [Galbibacter sp. EGI 63066]